MKQIYILLSLATISYFSFGQSPELIKDINTQHNGEGAPSELVNYNGYIYFVKDDGTNGLEVWRTDGTTTEMYSDIDNELYGDPYSLIVWNSILYFSTDIQGLWKVDGTPENTTLITGLGGDPLPGGEIIPAANVIFLYTGSYIYVTNGSDEINGVTSLFSEIPDREIQPVGDDLFYVAETTDEGKEVHFADITDLGGGNFGSSVTILDNVISGSEGSEPANLTAFNGKCYWVALKDNSNGNGTGPKALIESDGTLIGTTEFFTYETSTALPLYNTTPKTTDITVVNSKLLYYNMTGVFTSIDVDVYAYDGTNAPSPIQQITNNSPGGIPALNRLQFLGQIAGDEYYDIPGVGDYSTDGSSTSVSSLTFNQTIHINKMVELGSELLYSKFNDDENLYKSDLSGNESTVYTFTSGFSEDRPKELTILGSEVFFIGYDDLDGIQIWKTDGTNPNTSKVTTSSFPATRGSFPTNFFELSNEIYFTAISDLGSGTSNLYKTDGTEGNTVEVINSNPNFINEGGVVFDNAYFFNATPNILKKFDGTTVSTVKTLEVGASQLTVSGSNLFFTSSSAGEGTELWVSDGTEVGTEVFDLFPGAGFSSSPDQLVDVNGTLYFRAIDPSEGTKGLWKSDGSEVGTEVVFNDVIGDVDEITVIGDQIFFTIDDLIIGEEVKVYNTINEEITKIDMVEGAADGFPDDLVNFNGSLYLTYQFSVNTRAIAKLNPSDLTFSNIYYFSASDASYSSGEVTVTPSFMSFRVSDSFSSFYKRLTVTLNDFVSINDTESWNNPLVIEDIVYFENSGTLYESNGFISKAISSDVNYKVGFNDQLIFPFDDGELGSEPHKYTSSRQGLSITSSSNLQFVQDGSNVDVSWDSGSGDGRLLIASNFPNLNLSDIQDGQVYEADPMYLKIGTSIAEPTDYSSSHLVAKGAINMATVTDFTPGQTYYFTLIEYTDLGGENFQYDLQGAYSACFEVVKLDQEIMFDNPGETLATETIALDATSTSGLAVNYGVSGPASISGSELVFGGSGEVTLTINQPGNSTYNPAEELVVVFDVIKADQNITFELPDAATYLDDPIMFTPASSDASLILEYGITGPGQLAISNDEVIITGAGTIEVTVSNDGNSIYNPVSVTETIAIAKADHTITVNEIEDIPYGSTVSFSYGTDPNYEINTTAPPGIGTGLIAISILSGPAEVSETNAQQLTITGVGTVEFEVTNEGNDNFNPAATSQGSFEAVKVDQTIIVNGTLPTEIPFSDGTYNFENQFSTLSGEVSYVIIDGPGFFSGEDMDIYNITETGEVTVSAWAPTSDFYNGSLTTEFTFTVIKADQTILYEGITNGNANTVTYDPNGIVINAEATSGLDLTYEITGFPEGGSLDNNILTVSKAGTFEITISQPGNESYNAAEDEVQIITVLKADQTITSNDIPDKLKSDDPFTVDAFSSSGLNVIIEKNSSNIELNGTTVTILTDAPAGQAQITISQDGNEVYNPALPVSLSFCISPIAPTLTLDNNIISSDNTVDQHEWYKDGVFLQVSDNSNNTFTPSESGTYTAVAQGGSCSSSDFSNEIVYEEVALGLEDKIGLILYPVPTSNFLNVSMDDGQNMQFTFEIVDATGRSLMDGPLKKQINVSDLKIGTFYLRLIEKTTESITVIPFIKE